MKGTDAPLVKRSVPVIWEPNAGAANAAVTHDPEEVAPEGTELAGAGAGGVVVAVPVWDTPATVMAHAETDVLALPELVNCNVQVSIPGTVGAEALVHVTTLALTCAELVNDPKRPNTNPAMAMAAMSVIAMRITVARTGKMVMDTKIQ